MTNKTFFKGLKTFFAILLALCIQITFLTSFSVFADSPLSLSLVENQLRDIVYVSTCKNNLVQVYRLNRTLTAQEIAYDAVLPDIYTTAVKLREATYSYNCHSYAWYSQSASNPYWMNKPSYFLTDGTYLQTVWNVGDRIVYYDSEGTVTHSGIITAKSGNTISQITVTSKWAWAGLYEHQGDDCPYTDSPYTFKVYRLCIHGESTHNFISKNSYFHTRQCEDCGVLNTEPHVLNLLNICTVCGGRGTSMEYNSINEEVDVQ